MRKGSCKSRNETASGNSLKCFSDFCFLAEGASEDDSTLVSFEAAGAVRFPRFFCKRDKGSNNGSMNEMLVARRAGATHESIVKGSLSARSSGSHRNVEGEPGVQVNRV